MKKLGILIITVILFLMSCNKDDCEAPKYCNALNPLEELPWLNKIYEDLKNNNDTHTRIISYKTLSGEEYIDVGTEIVGTIYNCSGETICLHGGIIITPCDTILSQNREYRLLYPE